MLTSLTAALIAVACTTVLIFVAFALLGLRSRRSGADHADFVAVLGTTLLADGSVPPLLAARLDRASALADGLRATGGDPTIIVSGGKTAKDPRSEASAMVEYLVGRGARSDRLLSEDESFNTEANIRMIGQIMQERRADDYRCVIVTSDYHCPRVTLVARRNGVPASVIGSATPARRWISGVSRDFAATVSTYWKPLISVYAVIAILTVLAS